MCSPERWMVENDYNGDPDDLEEWDLTPRPEDCDDACSRHQPDCDGSCEHRPGHINDCNRKRARAALSVYGETA